MRFETIARDMGFLEGPVALTGGKIAVTSIDRGKVYAINPNGSDLVELATTGGGANGATEGHDGAIFVAQNGGKPPARRGGQVQTAGIQAISPDGSISWVTQDPVSPNDLCFGPDGMLWITDPTRPRSRADGRLWRCDPTSSEAELLCSVPWYPNGIGFGLEDDAVYVASTDEQRIVRFPVEPSGLGEPETYIQMTEHGPDGFAFDSEGNLIIGAVGLGGDPGSVQVWSPEGRLLERYQPGSDVFYTNVAICRDGSLVVTSSGNGEVLITPPNSFGYLPLYPFRSGSEET